MTETVTVKLRGIFAAMDGVKIARPTKCAKQPILRLDDSITAEDIHVKTGCNADNIKVGTIRPGPGGLGAVWFSCPVASTKVLYERRQAAHRFCEL